MGLLYILKNHTRLLLFYVGTRNTGKVLPTPPSSLSKDILDTAQALMAYDALILGLFNRASIIFCFSLMPIISQFRELSNNLRREGTRLPK